MSNIYTKIIIFSTIICFASYNSLQARTFTQPPNKPLFQILYYANLNGNIENCNCGNPPLGGLDRIAATIKELRKANKNIVVIDGGDTFNSYSFLELNQALVKSYESIQPDIWVLAEQEIVEGLPFIKNALQKVDSDILLSNHKLQGISSKHFVKYPLLTGSELHVYSYIQPALLAELGPAKKITNLAGPLHGYKDVKNENFNILIFHGETEELNSKINNFSMFDLILTAHLQDENIEVESRPAIIDAGADGENIVHISLHKSENRIIITARRIAMGPEIQSDPKIKKIISNYKDIK